MSQHVFVCGLEYATTPNLQACLAEALRYDYSYIVTPIVHPRFRRPSSSTGTLGAFTRSDMILSPKDWTTAIIGRLSPYLDVNSPSPVVRQRHEDLMVEELKYCHSLLLTAIMLSVDGSWADSALSPKSLNVIGGLLKPGGISIPCYYKSYVAPMSSPRLWAAAKTAPCDNHVKQTDKNLETVWIAYMQNKHDIGEAKVIFTFEHPAKGVIDHQGVEMTDYRQLPLTPDTRSEKLIWEVQQDNVLHGFAGYFDCTLYGKEMINIVPSTNNPGMISWFPVFIPITVFNP